MGSEDDRCRLQVGQHVIGAERRDVAVNLAFDLIPEDVNQAQVKRRESGVTSEQKHQPEEHVTRRVWGGMAPGNAGEKVG